MNVVFIVLDTLRRDRVGAYSDAVEFTPHLDRFADDAVVYEDAVAQAPWTLPSHASMFTGLYPWEHDATQKNLYLETEQELLAERFDDAGYRTACYTANTWLSPYTGMTDGFDEVDNFFPVLPSDLLPGVGRGLLRRVGERTLGVLTAIGDRFHAFFEKRGDESKTATILETAERFIDGCGDDEEFFLFLNLLDPHEPYYPPEEYRERHAPDVDPHELCHDPGAYYAGEEDVDFEAMQQLYDASVDYLDDQVGGFLDTLAADGVLEDTVVVIVSDHGQDLGEDGRFGHQFTVSEETVRVPLMVRAPELEPARVAEQVELRALYDAVPRLAGLDDGDGTVATADIAKGGYAEPQLDLQRLPAEKQAVYRKALSFVRGRGQKVVREENGDAVIRAAALATGDAVEPDAELLAALDGIGAAAEGETDVTDEQVKERLEDLGYM